jgi:hypothetical protein
MTDKLTLYNMALGYLEQRALASLAENREPRRVLDAYWAQEVAYCLERKFWNFSYRTVSIDASTTLRPSFDWLYAFGIPPDWIRTRMISAVQTFTEPLLAISEQAGAWWANITPIYVQYNSNDPNYGMNIGAWPASFADYVVRRLARQTCKRITGSTELLLGAQGLIEEEKRAYKIANANCAMNEAVGFAPVSKWIRSRRGFASLGDEPTGPQLVP